MKCNHLSSALGCWCRSLGEMKLEFLLCTAAAELCCAHGVPMRCVAKDKIGIHSVFDNSQHLLSSYSASNEEGSLTVTK